MSAQSSLDILKSTIGPLVQAGRVTIIEDKYDPKHFGNALSVAASPTVLIRLISDRGQLFADVGSASGPRQWFDVRSVLGLLGIANSNSAVWSSAEELRDCLRTHLSTIEGVVENQGLIALNARKSPP